MNGPHCIPNIKCSVFISGYPANGVARPFSPLHYIGFWRINNRLSALLQQLVTNVADRLGGV